MRLHLPGPFRANVNFWIANPRALPWAVMLPPSRRPSGASPNRIPAFVRAFAVLLLACLAIPNFSHLSAADPPQLAIYVMNADGTALRKLAQAPGQRWHAAPSWSNDGRFVVFHAHPTDASTPDSHIFVVNDDGSDVKDLGPGAFAAWSPDNKQLLFSIAEQNKENAQVGVWVMNADGKGRQFLFAGTAPSFSPDGSRILFVSSHEGNQFVYTYEVLEGTPKKILQEPYQRRPGNARWSADGKRVAFIDERGGKVELYLIDAAGSEKGQTMRHRGLIGGPVAWGPGNKLLLWSKEKDMSEPQKLHVILSEGDDAPIVLPNQDAGTLNFDPAWSPDGQRIVFVSDRGEII